jgi:hypothetical protein
VSLRLHSDDSPTEDTEMDLIFTSGLIALVAISFGTLGFLSGFIYQGTHPVTEHIRQQLGINHG